VYNDNGGGEPGGDMTHGTGENRSFSFILSGLSLPSIFEGFPFAVSGLEFSVSRQSNRTFLTTLVELDGAGISSGAGDCGGLGGLLDRTRCCKGVDIGLGWGLT
jgi:hypothetical protein